MATRLRRSGRVFLLTVSLACVLEIAVDAHVTLAHVNVVRGGLKQKGRDYVSILRRAARRPMADGDTEEFAALAAPFFGDPEVVHVRFRDLRGRVIYQRSCEAFGSWFREQHGRSFEDIFKRQLERDTKEIDAHGPS